MNATVFRCAAVIMLGLLSASMASAQAPPPPKPATPAAPAAAAPAYRQPSGFGMDEGLGTAKVPTLVNNVVSRILPMVGALFLLMYVYGGFVYLTAGGDGKKVEKAKTALMNATIGIVLVSGAYFFISYFLSATSSIAGI